MNDQTQNNSDAAPENDLLSILSDPNALSGISGALKRLGIFSSDEEKEPFSEDSEENSAAEQTADLSPLSALAGNDELMKRIPQILSLVSRLGSAPKKDDKRSRLLLALRPYLSARRQDAIDRLIALGAVGDALKSLK